jgi:hypothetical protein
MRAPRKAASNRWRVSSLVYSMLTDFGRTIRKSRRWVRNRIWFFQGFFYTLTHWAESAKIANASAAEMQEQVKDLIEGSDNRILFLYVGSALTAWAKMEEPLILIFGMLLGTTLEKAGLILYSIINFNVWISLIDELFIVDDLYPHLKPKWNKLSARLRRIKDDRDRLAHHLVDQESKSINFGDATLRPSNMDIRQKSLKFKPMNKDDVLDFTSIVSKLTRDLASTTLADF